MRPTPAIALACLCTLAVAAPATPNWTAPANLTPATATMSDGSPVVVGPDGAVVVWSSSTGAGYSVRAAARRRGEPWSAPVTIGADGGLPVAAAGPDGTVVVLWQSLSGTSRIHAATRTPDGTWSGPTALSAAGEGSYRPHVAASGDGTFIAVWESGLTARVQTATRTAGGAWGAPVDLSNPGSHSYAARVVAGPDGTATAAWDVYVGGTHQIQAATRDGGGVWSAPVLVTTVHPTAPSDHSVGEGPHLSMDAAGVTTAVWTRGEGLGVTRAQASTHTPGSGWSAPVNLSVAASTLAGVRVTGAPDGTTTAAWWRHDGSGQRIETATRAPGGAWQTPVTHTPAGLFASRVEVAAAQNGTTAVSWSIHDGSHRIAQAATRPPGGSWSAPVTISPTAVDVHHPRLAMDASGSIVATWARGTQGMLSVTGASVEVTALDRTAPLLGDVQVPSQVTAGGTLAVAATATDLFSGPVGIRWDFGDGTTADGATATHTYTAGGDRTVTVTATDAAGNTATVTRTVTVQGPAPQAPPAPPPPPAEAAPAPAPPPRGTPRLLTPRHLTVLDGVARVGIRCGRARCAGRIRLVAGRRTLATRAFTVPAGATGSLPLRLTGDARRLLGSRAISATVEVHRRAGARWVLDARRPATLTAGAGGR